MKDIGIILVQHGDFPFDFKDKERKTFDFIESMIDRLCEETRKIPRAPDDPYEQDISMLAGSIRKHGGNPGLEVGFMEFSRPTVDEAFEKLIEKGYRKIVFVNTPGIMMRSSHSLMDVPEIIEKIAAKHEGYELIYAKPGAPLPEIAGVLSKKLNACLDMPMADIKRLNARLVSNDIGVLLVAHGDVPLDVVRANKGMMKKAEKHIAKWSDEVRDWPRDEQNDPLWHDTLKLVDIIRKDGHYDNFEVGNLEFASPTLEDALNAVVLKGAKKVFFVGGTGFFDRSSHTLVDIPEAVDSLRKAHPDIEMEYVYPDMSLVCDDLADIVIYKANEALHSGIRY